METSRSSNGLAWRGGEFAASTRELASEAAVAISYNGTSHAVLMATPDHLEDLAFGFTLSEGIASPSDITSVEVLEGERGFDVQVSLSSGAASRLEARRRSMAGPVGCGMCGLESIDAAMRAIPAVSSKTHLAARDIAAATRAMSRSQELNLRTRSVHAAACYCPGDGLKALREDVGRHNALDKLIGASARQSMDISSGAIVVSSRLSIELVQKAASINCGILIAVSAPTALAVDAAQAANMTLVAIARGDEFEIFSHPERILPGAMNDVA